MTDTSPSPARAAPLDAIIRAGCAASPAGCVYPSCSNTRIGECRPAKIVKAALCTALAEMPEIMDAMRAKGFERGRTATLLHAFRAHFEVEP